MDKKEYIFVTTVSPGTDDEFKVVSLTAEDALSNEDGEGCTHEIYEKVKDVTITKTVHVKVKEIK